MDYLHDEMTPLERMIAMATGKPMDRVPCMPLISDHAYRLTGASVSACCHSAQLMAQSQIIAFKTYGCDGAGLGPGLYGIAEAMGSTLAFPADNVPYVAKPALADGRSMESLEPANPHKDGRLPLVLEALKICSEEIGQQVPVGSSVGGPFTTACSLLGTETFLKELHKNPEAAHRLLQLATESVLNYIDAVCDLGIKPGLAEPTASGTLIGKGQFTEFALPYLKMCVDRIAARCGSGPMLHICGNTSRIWPEMADTGATILSLDDCIDIGAARQAIGHRAVLAGNVKPVDTIMNGTRQQIFAEVIECLQKAADSPGGYILATGCAIPLEAPPENVLAFMEAARRFGRFKGANELDRESWNVDSI